MTNATLLCVGSGLAPRYKANTLQALALPKGSRLQFRYLEQLIPDGLREPLAKNELLGAAVILGYVDCTPAGRQLNDRCFIIPYRRAKLLNSERRGSIFILTFELGEFSFASNLQAFQESLSNTSPHWNLDKNGQPVLNEKGKPTFRGAWCQQLADGQHSIATSDFGHWQTITKQLRAREDFSKQSYFFLIEGLFHMKEGAESVLVSPVQGEYRLSPNRDYEFRLIHYDPDSDEHTGEKPTESLKFDASTPLLTLKSTPLLIIDSPYDLKSVHFSTGDGTRTEYGSLSLHFEKPLAGSDVVLDMSFPLSVKGNKQKLLWNGIFLGVLLTATQLVSIFSKGGVDHWKIVSFVAVILGFLTGFFVSFGMRKPL